MLDIIIIPPPQQDLISNPSSDLKTERLQFVVDCAIYVTIVV